MSSWRQNLEAVDGVLCKWNVDLTNLSTFRMSSHGSLLEISSEAALAKSLQILNQYQVPYRVLGWGANQVLAHEEKDVLIKLNFPFDQQTLNVVREDYELPASVGLNVLSAHALKFGLKGWEVLTGIPASLGGALFMNAGTSHGEIRQIVKSVRVMEKTGHIRNEQITADHFSYRKNHFVRGGEVIVGAVLFHHGIDALIPDKIRHYLELRRQSQPLATKNCGCVFKNASPTRQAGRLIDVTGLKELIVGALRVSPKHANFMENLGGADAENFQQLVKVINRQMELHWGVGFELEVKALYP